MRVPALLVEAGNSVTPPGQMQAMQEFGYRTTYVKADSAGHLVHDEAPRLFRVAVGRFLSTRAHHA